MKIPTWLLSLAVGAMISGEGWTLSKVIALGEDVAEIRATLKAHGYSQHTPDSSQSPVVLADKR